MSMCCALSTNYQEKNLQHKGGSTINYNLTLLFSTPIGNTNKFIDIDSSNGNILFKKAPPATVLSQTYQLVARDASGNSSTVIFKVSYELYKGSIVKLKLIFCRQTEMEKIKKANFVAEMLRYSRFALPLLLLAPLPTHFLKSIFHAISQLRIPKIGVYSKDNAVTKFATITVTFGPFPLS